MLRTIKEISEENYLINPIEKPDEILRICIPVPDWIPPQSGEYNLKKLDLTLFKEEYDQKFSPIKKRCAEAWERYSPLDQWLPKKQIWTTPTWQNIGTKWDLYSPQITTEKKAQTCRVIDRMLRESYWIPLYFFFTGFACLGTPFKSILKKYDRFEENEDINLCAKRMINFGWRGAPFTSFGFRDEYGRLLINWGFYRREALEKLYLNEIIDLNFKVPILNLNNFKIYEDFATRQNYKQIIYLANNQRYPEALELFSDAFPLWTGESEFDPIIQEATVAYVSQYLKKDEKQLSEILEAIAKYTVGGRDFHKIKANEDIKSINLLSEYIRLAPKYYGNIFRGISFYLESEFNEFLQDFIVGGFYIIDRITSFSRLKEVAETFTASRRYAVIIKVLTNKTGVSVEGLSKEKYRKDAEILVPIGTTYKILAIKKSERHCEITLEEIEL